MKKLFVSVLAIVSMVACMNDEIVSVQKGNPIAFDSFVENATRVGYNSGNLDGFDVWAFMDSTSGVILTDEDVTGGKGNYTYTNTQYWIPGHTYYFAALAPIDSPNVVETLATGDDALKGLGTVEFTNVKGTEDLLYAATSVVANDNQGPVNFQFNHLLSKVKFSFTNTFVNANYSFVVRNIAMTVPAKGTIDLTAGEYAWDILAGETTLAYGDTGTAAKDATVSPADERLTIPASTNQKYILTFDVDLYVGANKAMTYNKKSEITGIALEPGKAYNFAANIDAATLALDEIVFDAEVDEWGTGTGAPQFAPYKVEVAGVNYENFAEAAAKAMELNQPVKFFQHVAIDADTTIEVPADKTLSLELNGYTLTGVTRQTGSNRDMFTVKGTMNVNGAPLTRAAAEGNGCINIKHIGTDMEWSNCTDIFRVSGKGKLNLNEVTAKNLGGTKMAYVVDMSNANDLSVNITNSTLESTYIPVRLFNNAGKHTVTISNTSLTGKKCCVWVQYGVADGRDQATLDETVILNVYNPTQNNTFTYTGAGPVLYGFNEDVFFDENGMKAGSLKNYDEFLAALSDDTWYTDDNADATEFIIEDVADYAAFTEAVNSGNDFAGKTIKLANDIDLYFKDCTAMADSDPVTFRPIGDTKYNGNKPFKGTFDGQGHTIKNLYQNGWDLGYQWGEYGSYGLFGELEGATVKNVVIEGSESYIEGGDVSFIAGSATGTCVFENITIKDSTIATYNNGCGGIIGWSGAGNYTFKNITLESDVVLGGLWGSFDSSIGGIVGQAEPGATYNFENVTINCRIDAYNDCTASYDYYNYRMCGMIIGRCKETTTINGKNYPDLSKYNLSFNNVVVNYGDWMNYHYCRRSGERAVRIEPGYSYGGAENRDHSGDNAHCMECIPFNQLIGGDQYNVKGLPAVEGVTVNYPASYRREVSTAAALTEALGKGVSVILNADIDLGSNILTLDKGQTLDLGGKTLTQSGSNRGIILKNGASLKNGVINHSGIVAAVRAWNIESIENVTINLETPASGTVTGIAVQQYSTVGTIKDVTVQGAGVTQAIEVPYQATVNLIEKVTVDNSAATNGVALVINGGKVGMAKNCTFKGNVYGVTMHLKGVFAVGLELENCTVEGTTASIYAWDEKGISNTSGSFDLVYDSATEFIGAEVYDFEDECKGVVTINGATLQ